MKNITDYLYENLEETNQDNLDALEKLIIESDEKVTDEKSFREWAESKFKSVFGDDYDEDEMKNAVDGLLDDNEDLVKADKWGELVGKMNKSFAD